MKHGDGNNEVNLNAALDAGQDGPFLSERPSLPLDKLPIREEWIALCAQAAVEQDPKKLLELVSEINRLLDARRKRLLNEADGRSDPNSNG
jgi:hypothetical protein